MNEEPIIKVPKLVLRVIEVVFGLMSIVIVMLPTAGFIGFLAYASWHDARFENFRWTLLTLSIAAGACVVWQLMSIRVMRDLLFGEPLPTKP